MGKQENGALPINQHLYRRGSTQSKKRREGEKVGAAGADTQNALQKKYVKDP